MGYGDSLIGVNDYGMLPGVSVPGRPGIVRVDVNRDSNTCEQIWAADDKTNTGCLKLSTQHGLVYNNINTRSFLFDRAVGIATRKLENNDRNVLIRIVEGFSNFLSDNWVLARNYETGEEIYKYHLNNGRGIFRGLFTMGETNGWTFFVSNQIGPAGELYLGTLNAMKVLYDTSL